MMGHPKGAGRSRRRAAVSGTFGSSMLTSETGSASGLRWYFWLQAVWFLPFLPTSGRLTGSFGAAQSLLVLGSEAIVLPVSTWIVQRRSSSTLDTAIEAVFARYFRAFLLSFLSSLLIVSVGLPWLITVLLKLWGGRMGPGWINYWFGTGRADELLGVIGVGTFLLIRIWLLSRGPILQEFAIRGSGSETARQSRSAETFASLLGLSVWLAPLYIPGREAAREAMTMPILACWVLVLEGCAPVLLGRWRSAKRAGELQATLRLRAWVSASLIVIAVSVGIGLLWFVLFEHPAFWLPAHLSRIADPDYVFDYRALLNILIFWALRASLCMLILQRRARMALAR